jgi:hypothetical protein
MMVMMMAITPSVKASSRALPISDRHLPRRSSQPAALA